MISGAKTADNNLTAEWRPDCFHFIVNSGLFFSFFAAEKQCRTVPDPPVLPPSPSQIYWLLLVVNNQLLKQTARFEPTLQGPPLCLNTSSLPRVPLSVWVPGEPPRIRRKGKSWRTEEHGGLRVITHQSNVTTQREHRRSDQCFPKFERGGNPPPPGGSGGLPLWVKLLICNFIFFAQWKISVSGRSCCVKKQGGATSDQLKK